MAGHIHKLRLLYEVLETFWTSWENILMRCEYMA